MRATGPVFLIVAIGCAVWARASFQPPEPVFASPESASARTGLSAALEDALGDAALDLSTRITAKGDLIFRARAPRATSHLTDPLSAPVHGRARAVCMTGLDLARCWRITEISVDGEPLNLKERAADAGR